MSKKYHLYKLNFRSPVHIGRGQSITETDTRIEADQLFSAFCHGYLKLFGKDKLKKLFDEIPFKISSTFPFFDNNYFLPRPAGIPALEDPENEGERLGVDYFDLSSFTKLIKGEKVAIKKGKLIQNENVFISKNVEVAFIWKVMEDPRVTLDRSARNSAIYHVGKVTFSKKSGLYFLADCNKEWAEKIENVFELLGDVGIGGERSSGYGQFKLEKKEVELDIPKIQEVDWFTTLSPYLPAKDEIYGKESFYRLIRKSGWIYSSKAKDLKKRPVRYFGTSSTFPEKGQKGRLVDVSPNNFSHKVYLYALPFKVGLEVNPWEIE